MRIDNEQLNAFSDVNVGRAPEQTVSSRIYRALRQRIMTMQLLPGTTMSEQEMADTLGVSRTPVREAFIRLAREKLLVISPQRRSAVAKISVSRVTQERFLRESLEQSVLEQFSHSYTAQDLELLEQAIHQQQEKLNQEDLPGFLRDDDGFHSIFFQATDHMLCQRVIERNCFDDYRLRYFSSEVVGIQALSVEQHQAIVDCVRSHSLVEAQALLRTHLRHLFDQMKDIREKYPEYFQE